MKPGFLNWDRNEYTAKIGVWRPGHGSFAVINQKGISEKGQGIHDFCYRRVNLSRAVVPRKARHFLRRIKGRQMYASSSENWGSGIGRQQRLRRLLLAYFKKARHKLGSALGIEKTQFHTTHMDKAQRK